MHFFIQGHPMVGKSYLLQSVLSQYPKQITGFTPQRLYCDNEVVAYRAEIMSENSPSIRLDGDYNPKLTHIFMDKRKQIKDVLVLEALIEEVQRKLKLDSYEMVMLDEIGGFEMNSKIFVETLLSILESHACIGVIKHPDYALKQFQTPDARDNYARLVEAIQQNGSIQTLDKHNYQAIEAKFIAYMTQQ